MHPLGTRVDLTTNRVLTNCVRTDSTYQMGMQAWMLRYSNLLAPAHTHTLESFAVFHEVFWEAEGEGR